MFATHERFDIAKAIFTAAVLLGALSIFLPWLATTYRCGRILAGTADYCSRDQPFTLQVSGFRTAWGVLYFVVILDIAPAVILRTVGRKVSFLPVQFSDWRVGFIAGAILFAVTLAQIGFLQEDPYYGITTRLSFGWGLAFVAAIAVCAGAWLGNRRRKLRPVYSRSATVKFFIGLVLFDSFAWGIGYAAPCFLSPYTCR